jgi:hypothetical protein
MKPTTPKPRFEIYFAVLSEEFSPLTSSSSNFPGRTAQRNPAQMWMKKLLQRGIHSFLLRVLPHDVDDVIIKCG